MMINEKVVSFRVEPYFQEAILQILFDAIIIVVMSTILICAKFPLRVCIVASTFYFAITLIFHYRVVIQAISDKFRCDYVTETVKIKSFVDEYTFAGDRFGHSNIRFFYPQNMQVQKYRIKVINNCGELKKLRSVMSLSRMLAFTFFDKEQIEYLQVTYLKRSKILISVDLVEEIDNKRKNSRKKSSIKKVISHINMSI